MHGRMKTGDCGTLANAELKMGRTLLMGQSATTWVKNMVMEQGTLTSFGVDLRLGGALRHAHKTTHGSSCNRHDTWSASGHGWRGSTKSSEKRVGGQDKISVRAWIAERHWHKKVVKAGTTFLTFSSPSRRQPTRTSATTTWSSKAQSQGDLPGAPFGSGDPELSAKVPLPKAKAKLKNPTKTTRTSRTRPMTSESDMGFSEREMPMDQQIQDLEARHENGVREREGGCSQDGHRSM